MNFDEYQIEARKTAIYPNLGCNLWYPALGLAGESGEVADKVKKIYRDKGGIVTADDRLELAKELGDVLWYITNVAVEAGIKLDSVATDNIAKLRDRKDRNRLHGSGDNR